MQAKKHDEPTKLGSSLHVLSDTSCQKTEALDNGPEGRKESVDSNHKRDEEPKGQRPQKHLKDAPLFIEACCGCALLSACMKKHGFDVLPIDFHGNKQRPFIHVVELDLRKKSTWEFLEFLVDTRIPFFFHAAPPCGTSSRARDRPMSDTHHGPPKLRSEDYPLGFPWLTGYWKAKVQSANDIYLKLVAFIFLLNLLGIFWSVENPGQGYMWDIEDFAILKRTYFFVLFHACIHGSRRKKLTAFLTNLERLTALAGFCRDDYEHLPWGYSVVRMEQLFLTQARKLHIRSCCVRGLQQYWQLRPTVSILR